MEDFPAGHSMDSCWFAVDEAGEVAFFDTGEGGAIPTEGFPVGGEAGGGEGLELHQVTMALLEQSAKSDPELAAVLPESDDELADMLDFEDELRVLASLGVYIYSCDEPDAFPYVRQPVPPNPAQLREMPEALTRHFTPGKLPQSFAEQATLAPGEYVPVASWTGVWFDTKDKAHKAEDGDEEQLREAEQMLAEHYPNGLTSEAAPVDESLAPMTREQLIACLREAKAEREAKQTVNDASSGRAGESHGEPTVNNTDSAESASTTTPKGGLRALFARLFGGGQ